MTLIFSLCAFLVLLFLVDAKNYTPEQIIISLTGKSKNTHVVSYVTGSSVSRDGSYKAAPPSQVWYGITPNALNNIDTGKSKSWSYKEYSSDVHVVAFTSLKPDTTYYYRVGVVDSLYPNGLSQIYSFNTFTIDTYAIYGDYGLEGALLTQTYDVLSAHLKDDSFQAIFHLGDIAYNLHNDNGKVGDDFLNLIQPLSANTPYMVVPGNHEKKGNFTHYKHRFRGQNTIGDNSKSYTPFYYSLNQEKAHFVFFDTEVYLTDGNEEQAQLQLDWLEADLKQYNKPENRQLYPWLITFSHKCDWHDLVDDATTSAKHMAKFVTLLDKYGADIHFCGHQHNYQRLFPGHQAKDIENTQEVHRYINPKHLIQIVVGSPGSDSDGIGHSVAPYPKGLAQVLFTYGFGTLKILNSTHLFFNYIETDTPKSSKKVAEKGADFLSAYLSMGYDEEEDNYRKEMFHDMYAANNHNVNDRIKASVQDYLTVIQLHHGERSTNSQDGNIYSPYPVLFQQLDNMSPMNRDSVFFDGFVYSQNKQYEALLTYQNNKSNTNVQYDAYGLEKMNNVIDMSQKHVKQTSKYIFNRAQHYKSLVNEYEQNISVNNNPFLIDNKP